MLPSFVLFLLIDALVFPRCALALAVVAVIAKPVYVWTYLNKGPDGRLPTVFTSNWSLIILTLATTVY